MKRRRNPKGEAWAQWVFGLGFPMGDPIVELAAAFAAGVKPTARMLRLAAMSAERWRASRDKKLRSAAASIERRVLPLAEAAGRAEAAAGHRYGERSLTGQPRSNPRSRRGAYYVRDAYLGDFLDFPSVKVAARFARNRFGCEPAADCVFVEDDERLVPIGALRRRNPRRRRSRRSRR